MTASQLLALVLTKFLESGSWPRVREIQCILGPGLNLRVLAADIGRDFIVCEEVEEGRCFLPLTGLATLEQARAELDLLARGVSVAAAHYETNGPSQVTAAVFAEALGVHGLALRRFGVLLRMLSGAWGASGADGSGDGFWVQTREDVFFYRGVSTFEALQAVQSRLNEERTYVTSRLTYRWRNHGAELRTSYLLQWPKVARQLEAMRARFVSSKHEEDFQSVGHLCREVLISLADEVFVAERHPSADGVIPSTTDAKRRLDAFLEYELGGGKSEEARRHAKAAVSLADALVHKRTASLRVAALCAEATVAVVNIASILQEPDAV